MLLARRRAATSLPAAGRESAFAFVCAGPICPEEPKVSARPERRLSPLRRGVTHPPALLLCHSEARFCAEESRPDAFPWFFPVRRGAACLS